MQIEIVRKSELTVQNWSGGTTTQLYIYPKNAIYAERNFIFRISTATIEQESSEFTKLPGINRVLMILEGELQISHKNHHTKLLKKFETDRFPGNRDTTSIGKVKDFNVMTTQNGRAEIKAREMKKNAKIKEVFDKFVNFTACYAYKGGIEIVSENEKISVNEGDFAFFEKIKNTEILQISANTDSELIWVEISL